MSNNEQFKEAFALFDKDGDGKVDKNIIGDLLRACGQNPTMAEVSKLEDGITGRNVDYQGFLALLHRNPNAFSPPGTLEDFCRGFQIFDKHSTGTISVGELRYILTNLGEKLSDEEVDELLGGVDVSPDGAVDYQEFVKMIMSN